MSSLLYTKKTNFVRHIYQNNNFFFVKRSYIAFTIWNFHWTWWTFNFRHKKKQQPKPFFCWNKFDCLKKILIQHKYCFKIVNKLFKNLHFDFDEFVKFHSLFDEMLIVFDENFVQILSVVEHDEWFDVVNVCFQKFYIWSQLIILKFEKNIRVNFNNDEFLKWINKLFFDSILNGSNKIIFSAFIFIMNSMKNVIESIYSLFIFQKRNCDLEFFYFWIFLTTLNTIIINLNKQIVNFFVNKNKMYENNDFTNVHNGENIVWKFLKILWFFNSFFFK